MKKTILTVASLLSFLIAPLSASAAINTINGQNGTAQTLATTSAATTTMHMKITSSANTHTFQWDNSPWSVNQGGTGRTSFNSGELIFGNGTSPLGASDKLTWDGTSLTVGGDATSTITGGTGSNLSSIGKDLLVKGLTISLVERDLYRRRWRSRSKLWWRRRRK
jgi:hypothetical protein